jgi:hypothetical protein
MLIVDLLQAGVSTDLIKVIYKDKYVYGLDIIIWGRIKIKSIIYLRGSCSYYRWYSNF